MKNPYAENPFTLRMLAALTHLREDEIEGLIAHEASTYYHNEEDTHVGWLPSLQRGFHITEQVAPSLASRVDQVVLNLTTVLDETVFIVNSHDPQLPTSSVFYTRFWSNLIKDQYGVEVDQGNFLALLPANPQKATYCGHADVILRLADRASNYTIATPATLLPPAGTATERQTL